MHKRISIIIPVYNVEPYLRRCLDSVIAQTYSNIEIILINDGSPDRCGEICNEYAALDGRIKVIHQENAGVCCARNAGIAVATGDYFGFVDPDDWISLDMYEYLMKNALEYDADITCCRYYRVIPGEEITSQCDGITVVYTPKEALKELITRFIIRNIFWNKLIKREVFDGIAFPPGRIYEGTAMVYKLIEKANKVVSLGDPKYYYYDNITSYINSPSVKHSLDFIRAHIVRYYDVILRHSDLKDMLIQDMLKVLWKLPRTLSKATSQNLLDHKEDFKMLHDFLNDTLPYFAEEINLPPRRVKALKQLKRNNIKGFKKAFRLLRVHNLFEKQKDALMPGKKKVKRQPPEVLQYINAALSDKLRELQLCELNILDEIVRICRKHNIKYYLYGGTLLGAVRHKGFIPWDDDMDIVMPRKDFDRFAKACRTDLSPQVYYQTCFTDKQYPMLYAKIRKHDTYVCEEKWLNKSMHQGVCVDIFPLDRFPKNRFLGSLVLNLSYIYHRAVTFEDCRHRRISVYIISRFLKLFPNTFIYRLRDWLLRMTNALSGKTYYCSFGSHYRPLRLRVLRSEWFGEGTPLEFEGKMYVAPSQWEKYLLHLFGETYMQLPPEDKRFCHVNLSCTVISKPDVDYRESCECGGFDEAL